MPSTRKVSTGRSGFNSESFLCRASSSSPLSPTTPGHSTATPSPGTSHPRSMMEPSPAILRPMPNASSSKGKKPTPPRKENKVRPMKRSTQIVALLAIAILVSGTSLSAQRGGRGGGGGGARGGGGGAQRSSARSSVNSPSRNVNQKQNRNNNVNRNNNTNVNVDNNYHGGGYYGGGCCYHPVATAAAVTATAMVTAAVIGSVVNSPPAGCSTQIINGLAYQNCNGTWYQPQMSGSSTTYIVVNAP